MVLDFRVCSEGSEGLRLDALDFEACRVSEAVHKVGLQATCASTWAKK